MRQRRIVRVGHRGAAGHVPENTVAAILKGIALGADFVEVDVRASREGRLVVIHDATVDRTTNGTGVVAEMTWEELQNLDAGEGERVPSVGEALAAATGVGVILEPKVAGIAAELLREVKASGFAGATPRVLELFNMTKVDTILPLAATVDEVDIA